MEKVYMANMEGDFIPYGKDIRFKLRRYNWEDSGSRKVMDILLSKCDVKEASESKLVFNYDGDSCIFYFIKFTPGLEKLKLLIHDQNDTSYSVEREEGEIGSVYRKQFVEMFSEQKQSI